jgi:hypothetical protein
MTASQRPRTWGRISVIFQRGSTGCAPDRRDAKPQMEGGSAISATDREKAEYGFFEAPRLLKIPSKIAADKWTFSNLGTLGVSRRRNSAFARVWRFHFTSCLKFQCQENNGGGFDMAISSVIMKYMGLLKVSVC